MHTFPSNRHAFTIYELIAVIFIALLLIGILLPAMGQTRCGGGSMNVVAQANLRSLNTGTANYAGDHNDLIFSFTWNAGESYIELSSRSEVQMSSQKEAAAYQAMNILQRSTGRLQGNTALKAPTSQLLQLRYSHLVLMDYLTDRQPEPIAASPFDKNLIDWQESAMGFTNKHPFPYADGLPTKPGFDMDPAWTDPAVMQLWPFGSSYQVVPHAWLNDEDPQYTPSTNTPHHMILQAEEDTPLGGRKMTEVAQPAAKVFMYEEFDHKSEASPLYASDPNARINLAFFDGSVRQEVVSDANSAQDQSDPTRIWQHPYLPLDTFPEPKGGLGDTTPLDLRFRWTKLGLAGIDYGP